MDICVRCGGTPIFEEYLCESCYIHVHPPKIKKEREAKKTVKHATTQEAIIQLRNVPQEVVDFVHASFNMYKVITTKEIMLPHGIDLRTKNGIFARKIGRDLQQQFGGMLKSTRKLWTVDRNTGSRVYQVTILFKQFPYGKGEQFEFKGKKYEVLRVGKDVAAQESGTKTHRILRFKELEKARVF